MLIAQAAIDRDPKYVTLLKEVAMHAKRWVEASADREAAAVAVALEASHGKDAISSWPAPTFTAPEKGDEGKKR